MSSAETMKFGIRKLDIFIVKQFGVLFIGALFICQFILMMQFLWQHIDKLIGKGLSMDVLAQFFWYMGIFLVPQALPLAILLSSLITFGNLGESSELTAIKAAGISLLQAFRPLIIISVIIALCSFYFQNDIGPEANRKLGQLLVSMKQKSPELEIPEGVFYDGIPNTNLYVQKKDMETGMLYGIMIYRMTNSFEDAAIILADSGRLQSTAEKKHLLLTLYNGEWFENMRSQELAGSASVPYRRETFWHKQIVLDFDGDFNLTDAGSLSSFAKGKSLSQLQTGIDSLNHAFDSLGRNFYNEAKVYFYQAATATRKDTLDAMKAKLTADNNVDSIYKRSVLEMRQKAVSYALSKVQQEVNDLEFRSLATSDGDKVLRQFKIEAINKFTLALSCIIFFFIGAPLGAIIRKGGLGIPIIVSVLVFITFYILDNTGYRMARGGMWTIWFGKGLATAVLAPLAAFFTYKANNDSAVFNIDAYRNLAMRMLGLRIKRPSYSKEVVINDPDYPKDYTLLKRLTQEVDDYAHTHNLKSPPNIVKVFFKYQPDHEIERVNDELEHAIEDLANSDDKMIVSELSKYPVLAVKAHTRPFERKWMNIAAFLLVPVGAFLYCRMWRFRLRLQKDLRTIHQVNDKVTSRIEEKGWNIENI